MALSLAIGLGFAYLFVGFAALALRQNEAHRAIRLFAAADQLWQSPYSPRRRYQPHELLRQFAAEQLAQAAWAVLGETGDKLSIAHVGYLRGLLAIAQSNYSEATRFYQELYLHHVGSEAKFLHAWGFAMLAYGLGELSTMQQQLQEAIDFAATPPKKGMMILALPVAALFFFQIGMNERAVELLALAYKHLVNMTGWLEKMSLFSDLCPQLEVACGAELFAAVWQRGQRLDLEKTAESLLTELTELGWGDLVEEDKGR